MHFLTLYLDAKPASASPASDLSTAMPADILSAVESGRSAQWQNHHSHCCKESQCRWCTLRGLNLISCCQRCCQTIAMLVAWSAADSLLCLQISTALSRAGEVLSVAEWPLSLLQ